MQKKRIKKNKNFYLLYKKNSIKYYWRLKKMRKKNQIKLLPEQDGIALDPIPPKPEPEPKELLEEKLMSVKNPLTFEEMSELAKRMSQTILKKMQMDLEFSQIKKAWSESIKTVETEFETIAKTYNDGFRMVDKLVQVWLNHEKKERLLIIAESGEIIKILPFDDSDYQKKLKFEEPGEDEIDTEEVNNYEKESD